MIPVFVPQIDESVRSEIERKLAGIEADNRVRILFAVESGSRAWGFPSPDSDYDVRFVYAHDPDWYLSLAPGRDVIELPISAELDINGWDIRKALNLLLKPNPVLLEWLSSPVRYRWDETASAALVGLAGDVSHEVACRYHYLSLGEGQWRQHIGEAEAVNVKKYFYVLRPALALRWLRMHPHTTPPMNLQALIAGLALDEDVVGRIAALLEAKARSKELGVGPRVARIDALITGEFALARELPRTPPDDAAATQRATELFRRIVRGELAPVA